MNANRSRAANSPAQGEVEALFAAALWQLHRRDTLVVEQKQAASRLVADVRQMQGALKSALHILPGAPEECAGFAAGISLQQQRSAHTTATPKPVVIALLSDLPALKGVLQLVQENALPVLLVAVVEPESRADTQRRQLSTKVPIMPVDATDVVALCRVLQECLLRARNGWGGAVLQALRLPDANDPLILLEGHLRKRSLKLPNA